MRQGRLQATVSAVTLVLIVAAGTARFGERRELAADHRVSTTPGRSAGPSCLPDSTDIAWLPVSIPLVPPRMRSSLVPAPDPALQSRNLELSHPTRSPPLT